MSRVRPQVDVSECGGPDLIERLLEHCGVAAVSGSPQNGSHRIQLSEGGALRSVLSRLLENGAAHSPRLALQITPAALAMPGPTP
jgi:hypothetical protein